MANLHGGVQTTVSTINLPTFLTEVHTVVTAGTPVNPPSTPIPDGVQIVIHSRQTNGSKRLYVANSSANALLPNNRLELRTGESVVLALTNLNAIWLNSSGNNTEADIIAEQ
jgi:hypothetical protein